MARVNYHNAEVNKSVNGEKLLHELAPAFTLRLRDLGVAVSGKIDEVNLFIDEKIVYMNGLSGRLADSRKVFPIQKPVYDRGFADI